MKRKETLGQGFSVFDALIIFVPIIIFMLCSILPFLIIVSSSLSSSQSIAEYGAGLWPRDFTWDAYKVVFQFPDEIINAYVLSISVTIIGTLLNLILSTSLAYAICKLSPDWSKALSFFSFFTVMFGAGMVPTFIFYKNVIHLYDTFAVLVLNHCIIIGYVFNLRVFFMAVPPSLYEAAEIDGASEYKIFFSIAIPLIIPGLATVGFYTVLHYWNDANSALVYAPQKVPIALYLTKVTQYVQFLQQVQNGVITGVSLPSDFTIPEKTMVFSLAIITTIPMLIFFMFFQKFFVRGLTAGSVKG